MLKFPFGLRGLGGLGVPPGSLGYRKTSENTAICCSGATWVPENLRKHCYLLLRSYLGAARPAKTPLFAAPELLGHRNTSENTAICCSGATWAPQVLRKHCYMQLRGHLGARKPPKTILFVTTWAPAYLRKHCYLLLRSHLGARIPPKTLLCVVPEPLGLAQLRNH